MIIDLLKFEPLTSALEQLSCRIAAFNNTSEIDFSKNEISIDFGIVDFYREIKSPYRLWKLKQWLNNNHAPLVFWNRETPSNKGAKKWRQWLLKHGNSCDIFLSHSLQIEGQLAKNPIYFPNAADTRHYFPVNDIQWQWDVSFFGMLNDKRYPEVRKRADFLRALSHLLDKNKISYQFVDAPIALEEQRRLVCQSRINLQYHAGCDSRFHGGSMFVRSWGLPERCYGIPACGGLLLSDVRLHGRDDFGDEAWVAFEDNPESCLQKILALLDDPVLFKSIASKQQACVLAQHTYEHRAKQLLSIVNQWKMKKRLGQQ